MLQYKTISLSNLLFYFQYAHKRSRYMYPQGTSPTVVRSAFLPVMAIFSMPGRMPEADDSLYGSQLLVQANILYQNLKNPTRTFSNVDNLENLGQS